jgi:AraC family transcriptional regulator of arabinose operon
VGTPPERFHSGLRMALACRMLSQGDTGMADIARAVGFADPLHFSRRFRQFIGEPPTNWRKRFAVLGLGR